MISGWRRLSNIGTERLDCLLNAFYKCLVLLWECFVEQRDPISRNRKKPHPVCVPVCRLCGAVFSNINDQTSLHTSNK